jgi:hypothetical protein
LIWPVSPSTFKKGANSGGPPDFYDRIQPRKSRGLKASNSRPSGTRAKEKPAGPSRLASGLCERETEARPNGDVLVQWFTNDSIGGGEIRPRQELRKFNSRTAAVRVVFEKTKRRNARMIVEGAQFGYVDIVRMYAGRKE